MKRVRFETIPIDGKCQTEYKEIIRQTPSQYIFMATKYIIQ